MAAHRDPSDVVHRRAGPSSGARRRAAAIARLALAGLAAGALCALALARPPLLRVETPADGQTVGVGGVELLVRFEAPERVEPGSFRARLNGADVTGRLRVASNGAHGVLHALVEGPNELVLSVAGHPWWAPGARVESRRRLRVRYRPRIDWDRG